MCEILSRSLDYGKKLRWRYNMFIGDHLWLCAVEQRCRAVCKIKRS